MKKTTMEDIAKEENKYLGQTIAARFEESQKVLSTKESLNVQLISPTSKDAYDDWVRSSYVGALVTWNQTMVEEKDFLSFLNHNLKEREDMVLNILKDRPISAALENVVFTFYLTGVPRSMTHQIVRHRRMTFGQQSYRVSSCYSDTVRVPEYLTEDLYDRFEKIVSDSRELYKDMIKDGIPMEQARNIMQMGTTTKIVMVCNLGAFIDYVRSRTIDIAQDEHTYIVCRLCLELKSKQPKFFDVVRMFVPKIDEMMKNYKG